MSDDQEERPTGDSSSVKASSHPVNVSELIKKMPAELQERTYERELVNTAAIFIRTVRVSADLMFEELASRTGISVAELVAFEAARSVPTLQHLAKIGFHCGTKFRIGILEDDE